MEPTENNQNNSNQPIRIIPTRSGGFTPAPKPEGQNIFNSNVATPKVEEKIVPTPNNIPSSVIPAPVSTSVNSGEIQSENLDSSSGIIPHPEEKVKISPIHTYADDIKNTIQNDGVSVAKMMMAEVKKQETDKANEEEVNPTSTKNKSIIAISIVVILVAIAGFVGIWYFSGIKNQQSLPVAIEHSQSIIPYDQDYVITLDIQERKKIVEGIDSAKKQTYEKETSIVYLPIFVKSGTSTSIMKTNEFLFDLETRAPSALVRSFGDTFMFGLNRIAGQSSPFILLTSDSFNQMYAGMLEWEPAMADDIGDLFFTKDDLVFVPAPVVSTTSASTTAKVSISSATTTKTALVVSTSSATSSLITASTSTSTPIMSEFEQKAFKSRYIIANSLVFKDEVLNNRDLRVLRTVSGKTLMYYTFINDKILLIAKDFETLDEVVKRLATSQFKQ
jgi:hypothetical protein